MTSQTRILKFAAGAALPILLILGVACRSKLGAEVLNERSGGPADTSEDAPSPNDIEPDEHRVDETPQKPDSEPPDLSDLTLSITPKSKSLRLEASGARDNVTPTEKLRYLAFISQENELKDAATTEKAATVYGKNGKGDDTPFTLDATETIGGLEINRTYWLALKVIDEAGNQSFFPGQKIATQQTFKTHRSVGGTLASAGTNGWFPEEIGSKKIGACTTALGSELCAYDTQTDKLQVLKDIYPQGDSQPSILGKAGGYVIFKARSPLHGIELWRTDGTPAGTEIVKSMAPGISNFNSIAGDNYTAELDGKLYFLGGIDTSYLNEYQLYVTDGTADGTKVLKDTNPSGDDNVQNLTSWNGDLYFVADDGTNGRELWKSNGTSAGTSLLKDINSGGIGCYARGFTPFNGKLYFIARTDNSNRTLYETDGTAANTVAVKSWMPLGNNFSNTIRAATTSYLLLSIEDGDGNELWRSNGTTSGTVKVKDIRAGADSSTPEAFYAASDTVYFRANDGSTGNELWKTDGTSANTTLVKDINSSGDSQPHILHESSDGTVYLRADDGIHGVELWTTDGTPAGTTPGGEKVFFSATNGQDG